MWCFKHSSVGASTTFLSSPDCWTPSMASCPPSAKGPKDGGSSSSGDSSVSDSCSRMVFPCVLSPYPRLLPWGTGLYSSYDRNPTLAAKDMHRSSNSSVKLAMRFAAILCSNRALPNMSSSNQDSNRPSTSPPVYTPTMGVRK